MEKSRNIKEDQFIDFLTNYFVQKKVEISLKDFSNLCSLIHKCYDDDSMFDSWFLGIDVMN